MKRGIGRRRSRAPRVGLVFAVLVSSFAAGSARADDPKYEFGKLEEVKAVEWKAAGQVGLILTTGNSNTITLAGALSASRKEGKNKLSLDVGGAWARSQILTANDHLDPVTGKGDGTIDDPSEITTTTRNTAANVMGKLRYDRFFTANNSGYLSYYAGLDQPAGRDFITGGQIGYARQVYKSARHLLAAELGYDISYTEFITPVGQSTLMHSIRAFVGYGLTLSEATNITSSVEALINCNSVDVAGIHYSFGQASRVVGKIALTTRLWKNLSFRFGFTARFDDAPAAAPALAIPYGPKFLPLASKLDTMTEASIIVTFL